MKLMRLFLKRETIAPMMALTFASAVSVLLVIARILWTGDVHYAFLIWNLFLAWLPLLFSLLACDQYQHQAKWRLPFVAFTGAWLLFFPNAPYIFTDVVHLSTRFYRHFWVDLSLVLMCALTGLVLGFVSLYLLQSVVRRAWGGPASWVFIAAAAGLSGFGIFLGRFMRFNSWDVFVQPVKLYQHVGMWAADPLAHPAASSFPVLFGTFVFLAYLMLYALTHLPRTAEGQA